MKISYTSAYIFTIFNHLHLVCVGAGMRIDAMALRFDDKV